MSEVQGSLHVFCCRRCGHEWAHQFELPASVVAYTVALRQRAICGRCQRKSQTDLLLGEAHLAALDRIREREAAAPGGRQQG